MRICLISREYPPETGWGGIGAYTFQHANSLTQLGHEVELVALATKNITVEPGIANGAAPGSDHFIPLHRVVWGPILQDLATIWISMPYSHYFMKTSVALWNKFLQLQTAKPFDVVEAPEHLAEGIFPALTKICPLVIRLHTPQFKIVSEGFHNLSSNFDQQFIGMMERMAILNADMVTSPSKELARYVAHDCGLNFENVSLISNPVSADKFSPDGSRKWENNGDLTVFFAGRLEERKGIHQLVDAIALVRERVKNVRFILLGRDTNTGEEGTSVLKALQAKLHAQDLSHIVTFVDHIPLDEMPACYRSADVCVVPSLYDNAPYTVLEAMSCGKPLVASSAGGIPEYVDDRVTGIIVEPGNAIALAHGLIELLGNENLRKQYGEAARRKALKLYSKEEVACRTVEAYETARIKYQKNKQFPLYRKPADQLILDFNAFAYAYHLNLYDLLYLHSWRFRAKHWFNFSVRRPRLSFAKALVMISRPLFNRFASLSLQNQFEKFENDIAVREQEIHHVAKQKLLVNDALVRANPYSSLMSRP